jgi:ABC-type polysaccharide/polyol phosphate export permease
MATQDIKQRYRNSSLGPLWMIANLTVILLGVSIIYSELLKIPLNEYMPFLAISLILLNFIWPTLNESCHSFSTQGDVIRQVRLPLSVLAMRTLYRNIIVTGHNILVLIVVTVYYQMWDKVNYVGLVLGILLLLGIVAWASVVLAIAGARFRDTIQIVSSALNFMAIFTPIYWSPDLIKRNTIFLEINPFYHVLEIVRKPYFGEWASASNYTACLVFLVVGWAFAAFLYVKTYKKIAYWV